MIVISRVPNCLVCCNTTGDTVGLSRRITMALRALTAGCRTGRSQAVGSLTHRYLLGVRGFASGEQQVCVASLLSNATVPCRRSSTSMLVLAGPSRHRRWTGRVCRSDQGCTDGDESHLHRGPWKVGRNMPQHWVHTFQGVCIVAYARAPEEHATTVQAHMHICRHS